MKKFFRVLILFLVFSFLFTQVYAAETTVKMDETCFDAQYDAAYAFEYYLPWAVPGTGTALITKLWFWQYAGTNPLGSSEQIELALYEFQDTHNNNGTAFEKISGSVFVNGTGTNGWIYGELSAPVRITLGNTYVVGIGPTTNAYYRIVYDSSPYCSDRPPLTIGSYVSFWNDVLNGLDATVPQGEGHTTSRKYGIIGLSFFSSDPNDLTPPVISNITATNIGSNSATINWTTDEASNSKVDYGLTTAYGLVKSNSSFVSTHVINLTGLSPNTTYHYKVSSTDLVGNTSSSADKTFTTVATDTIPPNISITSPASGATVSGLITVQGTASDNVGVSLVEVSVDSGPFTPATGTTNWSFSLGTTSLSDGPHTINARATDTSGNTKISSVNVTVSNNEIPLTSCGLLNQAGVTYILQNNVSAPASCFSIGASNIVLDLNGKTVTFGTSDINKAVGVALPPGYITATSRAYFDSSVPDSAFVGADNIVIKNGSIIQGGTGGKNRIIFSIEGHSNLEIANIYGYAQGVDSSGIGSVEDSYVNFHDNEIEMDLSGVSKREDTHSAIGIAKAQGTIYVRNNYVHGNGHFGIDVQTKKALNVTDAEISGNTSRINGIATNPYQLRIFGFSKRQQGVTLRVFNNLIEAYGNTSSRGLLLEGTDSSADCVDGMKFYNNVIDVKEHCYPHYPCIVGWTHTIRIRDPDYDLPETKCFNNEFYNNTFKATGYYLNSQENGVGYNIRITLSGPLPVGEQPNIFHDNIIIAETLDSRVDARAILLQGHYTGENVVFRNNVITSNSVLIDFGGWGASNTLFESNTFNKGVNPIDFRTMYYNNGADSINNSFVDSTLGSGVNFSDESLIDFGTTDPAQRTFWVKWFLDLTVKNNSGQPVSTASVSIKDKTNAVAFTGTTDAQGKVRAILSEYFYEVIQFNPDIKTTYNPFTVTVTKSGSTANAQITMDSSKQLTLNLDSGAVNQAPILNPIGNKTITELSTLSFTVTASDADNDPITLTATNLPAGASFTDNRNKTGSFSWTPIQGTAGTFNVTFTAADASSADLEQITITVNSFGCTPQWDCSSWSSCVNNQQTRTCWDNNNCGTEDNKPPESQSCYVLECTVPFEVRDCNTTESCPGRQACYNGSWTECMDIFPEDNCPISTCTQGLITEECYCGAETFSSGYCCENNFQSTECIELCEENWSCSSWRVCSNGIQSRTCSDLSSCGITESKPSESQSCGSCVTGATTSCTTSEGCGGTQICVNSSWSSCNDIPNDSCPVPLKEIIIEVRPQIIQVGQAFTLTTFTIEGTPLINTKTVYAGKTYYTNTNGQAILNAQKEFTSVTLTKTGYATKTVNLNIQSIECGNNKCESPFEDYASCPSDCTLKELVITTTTAETKTETVLTVKVTDLQGNPLANVQVTYAGTTKTTNTQGLTSFIETEGIQEIIAKKTGYQTKIIGYSSTICSQGEQRDCTISNCPGKQTCSNGTWTSCIDIAGDTCPEENSDTTTVLAAILVIGLMLLIATKTVTTK